MRSNLLRSVLTSVFSFELLFTLYLLAGRFKGDPRFAWFPVDITFFFFLLSLLSGLIILIKKKLKITSHQLLGMMLYLLFAGWVLTTLSWAPPSSYAWDKALRIFALVSWAYVGSAWIIATDYRRTHRFFTSLVGFALWFSVEALLAYLGLTSLGGGAPEIMGGNYLGIGRVVGLGFGVLAVSFLLTSQTNRLIKVTQVSLMVFFVLVLLVIGGRGPLLATAIAFAITFLLMRRVRSVLYVVVLVAVTILASLQVQAFLQLSTLHRLAVLLEEPSGGTSAEGRLMRVGAALRQIQDSPLIGQGLGSFFYYYGEPGLLRDYPHNIVLEILAEAGIVGLFLFLINVLYAFSRIPWKKIGKHQLWLTTLFALLNTTLNAMASGDIPDNRLLFVALGLVIGLELPSSTKTWRLKWESKGGIRSSM